MKRVLEQNELCIYCDRRFGSLVLIDAKIVSLEAQPDHFQPVADRRNDNPSNIHAADQICNERIKGSRKFASLEEARRVIQAAWVERGWTDAPSLEAVCPAHIKRVLDFMQSSMPSTELLAAASGVAKFAPLFWSSK